MSDYYNRDWLQHHLGGLTSAQRAQFHHDNPWVALPPADGDPGPKSLPSLARPGRGKRGGRPIDQPGAADPSESQKTGASRRREEANLQEQIIQLLHLHGYFVAHFRPAMTGRTYLDKDGKTKNVWVTAVSADGAGMPDLIAVHGGSGHILVIEVKSNIGKLSRDQRYWRTLWQASPATYFLARPDNWEEFVALLQDQKKYEAEKKKINW